MRDVSGLLIVLCVAGLSACIVWCIREEQRHRARVARFWEPRKDQR